MEEKKKTILGLGIFTFHSHPQTGGICPVLGSDALSSQAPTDMYHPGREDDRLFLGCICMSSRSPSGCSTVGAEAVGTADLAPPGVGGGEASPAPRTDFPVFPRSDRGVRSSFWELVANLAADGATGKAYVCRANSPGGFSRRYFGLAQLCAVMLRCQFTSRSRARALCGVPNTLDPSLLGQVLVTTPSL